MLHVFVFLFLFYFFPLDFALLCLYGQKHGNLFQNYKVLNVKDPQTVTIYLLQKISTKFIAQEVMGLYYWHMK